METQSFVLAIWAFLCILQFSCEVSSLKFSIDTATDPESRMWKLKGFEYFKQGSELRQPKFAKFFPETFDLGKFDSSKGVWALFPVTSRECPKSFWNGNSMGSIEFDLFSDNSEDSNKNKKRTSTTEAPTTPEAPTGSPLCYKKANASIHFTLFHQLADSVSLRYSFGGDAKIKFTGLSGGDNYQLNADDNKPVSNWMEETVYLSGSSVHIDMMVFDKEDYVLIDKVTVETNEATTTTTRPSTAPTSEVPANISTEVPVPAPVSGQSKTSNVSFFMINALVCVIFKLFF